jgi:molecular chaperone HscB
VSQTYFEFFRLPAQFKIDLSLLNASYRKIQAEVHPDKFVTASPAERVQSMQTATLANEAYQTLKHPALRAAYLLSLQGITAISETNTAMPAAFLMQQMEWREELEDAQRARDIAAVEALADTLKAEAKHLQSEFATQFDENKDYSSATDIARKLIFIDKVSADIASVISNLEE